MKHPFTTTAIQDYCRAHSSPIPEDAEAILSNFSNHPLAHQMIGHVLGNLLRVVIQPNDRPILALEIGTLFGFSAAMISSSLPPGSVLKSLEELHENYLIASNNLLSRIEEGSIEVINSEGITWLRQYEGPLFDVIFLDARKQSFDGALSLLHRRLKKGGLLIIDNALAGGKVLRPTKEWEFLTDKFNDILSADERFLSVLIPIRDGVLLARRLS